MMAPSRGTGSLHQHGDKVEPVSFVVAYGVVVCDTVVSIVWSSDGVIQYRGGACRSSPKKHPGHDAKCDRDRDRATEAGDSESTNYFQRQSPAPLKVGYAPFDSLHYTYGLNKVGQGNRRVMS